MKLTRNSNTDQREIGRKEVYSNIRKQIKEREENQAAMRALLNQLERQRRGVK